MPPRTARFCFQVLLRPVALQLIVWMTFTVSHTVAFAEDRIALDQPVSFVNDVVPLLTKAGCNAGVCHAKAGGGQNGFQLSLLGFEPDEDYESLVKQGRGRRIQTAAAELSLVLRKASGQTPHGGGKRFDVSSTAYQTLHRWIAEGAQATVQFDPTLVAVEIEPARAVVPRNSSLQLTAVARYSNGSQRDVTQLALFETNSEAMAEVSETGRLDVQSIPGRVSVMVRYQGQAAVFTASVPLGESVDQLPASRNFVDQLVFSNLQEIGIPPSPVCDDSTFLRRVTLDIAGRLPTLDETNAFLASSEADKRDLAIDRLLRSPGYADYFANKWTSLLKNRRDDASDITSNFAFHAWIRDSLLANVKYDQIVRELLGATGRVIDNPPVAWYKRVKKPTEQLEDVAQLFLGVRLQCAQCHHHPFERWSQDDYYSLAAFFSQVGRKPTDTRGEDIIFHQRGVATAVNPRSGNSLRPAALGDDVGEISPDEDPRLRLAAWMTAADNPFFAKALVNRYWKHFMGRGLIEPEDDIRDTNPPTNPELLAALEAHFVDSGYDLKQLVRVITQSNAYQLSSDPTPVNLVDRQNYSRFYPRRLQAEVLLDSIDDLTGGRTTFANLPVGTRAIALPDNSYNKASQFLRLFGRPESASVCECERVQSSSLAQSLHLINSAEIKGKLALAGGRAAKLAAGDESHADKIRQIYLAALSREPTSRELETALAYLQEPVLDENGQAVAKQAAEKRNLQDLIWALMNTKEFIFNH